MTWYSLATEAFPESPIVKSSMRIRVKKTNVVASSTNADDTSLVTNVLSESLNGVLKN